jgi:hypothetical protein
MTRDTIDHELIDNLLKNYKKPEDLIGENGLLKQLTKQFKAQGGATYGFQSGRLHTIAASGICMHI